MAKQTAHAGAATTTGPATGLVPEPPAVPPLQDPPPGEDSDAARAIEESRAAALEAVQAHADGRVAEAPDGRKVVTGVDVALAVTYKQDGSVLSTIPVRRGEALPDGLSAAEVRRLTDLGVFGVPGARAAGDAGPVAAPAAEERTATAGTAVEKPRRVAPVEAWRDYAVHERGLSRQEADGLSKDELVSRYA